MNGWDFVAAHPVATFFILALILYWIYDIVAVIATRKRK